MKMLADSFNDASGTGQIIEKEGLSGAAGSAQGHTISKFESSGAQAAIPARDERMRKLFEEVFRQQRLFTQQRRAEELLATPFVSYVPGAAGATAFHAGENAKEGGSEQGFTKTEMAAAISKFMATQSAVQVPAPKSKGAFIEPGTSYAYYPDATPALDRAFVTDCNKQPAAWVIKSLNGKSFQEIIAWVTAYVEAADAVVKITGATASAYRRDFEKKCDEAVTLAAEAAELRAQNVSLAKQLSFAEAWVKAHQ